MNAFQPMIRNILEGKQSTDYQHKIKIVEKMAKTDCGTAMIWYLNLFLSIGIQTLCLYYRF